MGMSTYVVGFKPPDEKWRKMKAVWDACAAAKVELPEDVSAFFGEEAPDPAGVRVELSDIFVKGKRTTHACCREWRDDAGEGYEIDVKKLPPDVTVIRFYNQW